MSVTCIPTHASNALSPALPIATRLGRASDQHSHSFRTYLVHRPLAALHLVQRPDRLPPQSDSAQGRNEHGAVLRGQFQPRRQNGLHALLCFGLGCVILHAFVTRSTGARMHTRHHTYLQHRPLVLGITLRVQRVKHVRQQLPHVAAASPTGAFHPSASRHRGGTTLCSCSSSGRRQGWQMYSPPRPRRPRRQQTERLARQVWRHTKRMAWWRCGGQQERLRAAAAAHRDGRGHGHKSDGYAPQPSPPAPPGRLLLPIGPVTACAASIPAASYPTRGGGHRRRCRAPRDRSRLIHEPPTHCSVQHGPRTDSTAGLATSCPCRCGCPSSLGLCSVLGRLWGLDGLCERGITGPAFLLLNPSSSCSCTLI